MAPKSDGGRKISANFAVFIITFLVFTTLVVFAVLLLYNHFSIDRQEKQVKFDFALLAFMLYFAGDCFWAAISAEILPKTRLSVASNSFLLYLFMTLITYSWLQFVMAFEQAPRRNLPLNRFAVAFPFLVSTLVLILHYIIAPHTLIDSELNMLPAFSVYLVAVPYIYMAAILFYTIRKARQTQNPASKRKHLFVGFFPLMTIIGGLIEMLFLPEVPIFCNTSMVLMLVFYIQSLLAKVSLDPLTGLNNRGQLERYCSQRGNLLMPDRKTFVVMMDIDRFKSINDTYGHAEGDKALVQVSGALKAAMGRHNMPSFLCRYGGDEFIMIVHPAAAEEVEDLIRDIRAEVKSWSTEHSLSISAGYDELRGAEDSIEECIERADKKLYQDKKAGQKIRSA